MIASAILITKEKEYPKEILDSLPPFDEVLVETECSSVHKRYELALKAKNNLIYVQDDDCIIDIPALFKQYNGQLTNAITEHHKEFYDGTGVSLVGFGAFFPREMINFDRYLDIYGANPLFLSQADRVFTFLNQPLNSVVLPVNHLPTSVDSSRMSTQPDHYANLDEVIKQLQSLQNY